MRISPGIGHEPSLQRLVIASVILHFILMVFLFLPLKKDKEFKTYYVSLAEPAKVRTGGQTAARKAKEKPKVKKEAFTKKRKIVDKKAAVEKKDLEQKMSQKGNKKAADKTVEETIEKMKEKKSAINKLRENKEQKQVTKVEKKEAPAKGIGSAPGKEGQTVSDPYYGLITAKIQDEWSTYPTFESEGLAVEILLKIDSKGEVVPVIEKPSGNKIFDQAALKAISKASPLPPPPPWVDKEIIVRLRG